MVGAFTDEFRSSIPRAGAGPLPGPGLGVPGSLEVSALLMQDLVDTGGVSVAPGPGKVALFRNPYREGKEEALVIDTAGHLTHLRRADSGTGWAQTPVLGADGGPCEAAEVVVVVHPGDLSVWAIFAADRNSGAARLTGVVGDGKESCAWETKLNVINWSWGGMGAGGVVHFSVCYDGRSPAINCMDVKTGTLMSIRPVIAGKSVFFGTPVAGVIDPSTSLGGFAAGRVTPSLDVVKHVGDVSYVLVGRTLRRYSTYQANSLIIAQDVLCLAGVYGSYQYPDIGCLYVNQGGDLVSWNLARNEAGWKSTSATGAGLRAATSWTDANGMLHVYGLTGERGAGSTLKVLRQSSWGPSGEPVWAAPSDRPTPAWVGLLTDVEDLAVDPFPGERPALLVRSAGGAAPERVAVHTLDATGSQWSEDGVRLPGAADRRPRLVTRYVTSATVLDRRGNPLAGVPVDVSADRVGEIQADGASYLVGPGFGATLTTNPLGRVAIAVAADSLLPPTLHLDVVGLERGAVVQPASGVHEYLAGTGTLPSQPGLFTGAELLGAEVDDHRIVGPGHDRAACDGVAQSLVNVFALAAGRPMTSRTDPARRIHGFAIGSATADARVVYTEFASPDEAREHHGALRAHPSFAGALDDLADWLGDLWQGIKTGAVEVLNVVVDMITTVYVTIGDAVASFVVDTIDSAVRVAEAVVARVVDRVDKVVEWLKTAFDFTVIWQTKQVLQSSLLAVLDYTSSSVAHFGGELHGWFGRQEGEVLGTLEAVRERYRAPLGDTANQVPAVDDPSEHAVPARDLYDNPQGNWLQDRVFTTRALSAADAGFAVPDVPPALSAAWDRFVEKAEDSGIGDEAAGILRDLDDLLRRILDPDDPDQAAKAVVVPLIDILHRLVPVVLKTADLLQDALVGLVVAVVDALPGVLFAPLPPGPIRTAYDWVQESAGVADPEEPTLGGLLCLMAGCSFTTAYDLVHKEKPGPFPGGRIPTIPPPPWHPGHDPSAVRDAAFNEDMKKLRAACGLLTIGGAVANATSDLLPALPVDESWTSNRLAVSLIAGANTLFTSTTSAIATCPGVNGKDWHDWRATGTFVSAGVSAVLGFATLAAYQCGWSKVPGFANAFDVKAGPVLAAALATGQLVFSALGTAPNGYGTAPNAYSQAVSLLSPVPRIFQVVRFGIQRGTQDAFVRAGAASAVDLVVGGTVGLMTAVQSLLPGPDITQQTVPPGTLHLPYRYRIARTGERPDNSPLTWSATGALPPGLALDPATGVVNGTPTATGTFVCDLTCTDSCSPPQTSSRTGFGFVVQA